MDVAAHLSPHKCQQRSRLQAAWRTDWWTRESPGHLALKHPGERFRAHALGEGTLVSDDAGLEQFRPGSSDLVATSRRRACARSCTRLVRLGRHTGNWS
jgi:hypothetical protein